MSGNVIDIGELRIQRWRTDYLSGGGCEHKHLVFSDKGEIIECETCKRQVSAYWALGMFLREYERWRLKFEHEYKEFQEAKAKEVVLLAAQKVERAWRKRDMLPTCPHCHRGIGPHDRFGDSLVNKAIEARRREVAAKASTPIT